jgi:hypothetical protein
MATLWVVVISIGIFVIGETVTLLSTAPDLGNIGMLVAVVGIVCVVTSLLISLWVYH